ncbi:Magnesium/proton exchanger [Durusdinium trenchii]|uniref:Magnesium/proton exchanger n=1 Tax=Durusdinium trenchii TaxID=1381693 RepID=A0ABP0JZG8_9DINO
MAHLTFGQLICQGGALSGPLLCGAECNFMVVGLLTLNAARPGMPSSAEDEEEVPARASRSQRMAALAVEHLEFEDIASEDGVRNIMSRLKEFFLPHLEVSLPRAFEAAVYGKPRQSAESFPEYIARMERAFHRLSKEGVELLEGASGYIMYRQASLSEAHEQRLLTWCDGHYDKSSIVKALRKLDKKIKTSMNDAFLQMDEDEENEGEDYVFVAEGDLDAVYSESEMLEALASYKEVREALRNQRNGRGYYGRDHFKGKGHGNDRSWQKGKGKGKQRVHPSTSTDAFWLRKFVEERRASREVSLTDPDSDAVSEYKAASTQSEQFCGIVTGSEYGVVDTAAEGGLVGSFALHRLESRLKDIGLKVKWIPKRSLAKGVGGQAKVLGVVLIPIGIGGLNGVLEATVVEGEVPLLLPVKLMKNLKAIVDFNQYKFILPDEELHIPLHELPSGHVTIDVLQFQPSGFAVPSTAPFSSNDFVEKEVHNRAMLAQFVNKIQKLCPPLRRPHSRFVGRLLTSREEEKVKDVKMKSYARKPKMAVRNWRVLLDKLFTLLAFVERQQLIQEWLPELHSLSGPSMLQSKEEDSLEACYQKIIINAKVLHPLKSKEAPTVSMSTCVHPKAQLKGGGNKSASYIYCKMCHCRWESPLTAADIKEDLKKGKKGLLSQKMEEARTEQEVKVPAKEKEVSEKEQAEMWQELRRQRVDLQEKEVHIEAMMRALKTQKHELQEMIQKGVIQGAEAPAKKTQGKLPEEETPQCLCNEMAVKASRVDERTLEEKFFWVCKWGNCDFFQREPMKAIKDKAPSEMSFQMLGSTASSSHRGRRSKSPRLEKRTNRGETIPVPDSD